MFGSSTSSDSFWSDRRDLVMLEINWSPRYVFLLH